MRKDDPILSDDCPVKDGVKDWSAYLEDRDDSAVDLIRHCSITGRPCGDESFVARMEAVLGRKLVPRARDRPKRRGLLGAVPIYYFYLLLPGRCPYLLLPE